MEQDRCLVEQALAAREQAYAPYSNFLVGAAALFEDGRIFTGCNVENASYGGTVCAERVSIWAGVAQGEGGPGKKLQKIAIVGGKRGAEILDFCLPCGFCLQVMAEFAICQNQQDLQILLAKIEKGKLLQIQPYHLKELLPHSFILE